MQNSLREQRISSELEELREEAFVEVNECMVNGLSREDFWVVWVKDQNEYIEGEVYYPVRIQFPENYPMQAPIIEFPKDFLHVHVYEGGKICLPVLQQQYWQPKSGMKDLLTRIHKLIHQKINPYSPANQSFFQLFKNSPEKYQYALKDQAKRYKSKLPEYFKSPSVHIDLHIKQL